MGGTSGAGRFSGGFNALAPEDRAIWERTVESHLHLVRHVYDVDTLEGLARRAGFAIDPISGNGAANYPDVLRYLKAVDDLLGRSAWISAKLNVTNRMRELGLSPELPHAARTAHPAAD